MVRYMADLLNGVPSIVIGIFAWTVIVVPMHTLLRARRRIRAEPDADSDHDAQHGAVSAQCAAVAARRRAGVGRPQWKVIATVAVPAAMRGILTGMILGVARIAGESAPLLLRRSTTNSGRAGIAPADRRASGYDL